MTKIQKVLYYFFLTIIFVSSIFLRTKLYFASNVFEDDECRMALSMIGKNIWDMFLPLGAFSSTPIFMFVSKLIAELTKYNEFALKFLPFIFSLGSLVLFYKICDKYFKRKTSVLLCLYLMAVNINVLYFSSIFKTYSLEIFVSLLCLQYLPNIRIPELKTKQLIILALVVTILPLISLPSLFFIGIFFTANFLENIRNKEFYKKMSVILIPFIIISAIYYYFNLLPTKEMQLTIFGDFWTKVYSAPLISDIAIIVKFLIEPNLYVLYAILIVVCSLVYIIFKKEEHTRFNLYLCTIPILTVLVSLFHIYPTIIGRTTLFMIPIFFMVIVKLLDVLSVKRIPFYIISLMFFVSMFKVFTPAYLYQINDVVTTFRNFSPNILIMEIKNRYSYKTDEIVTTDASLYSFLFYMVKNNLNVSKIHVPAKAVENRQKYLYEYYDQLDPNKNYWFYLIKDYKLTSERHITMEWLKKQNIVYFKQDRNSYLYYISGIRK